MSWSRTYEGEAPLRVNKWLAQSGVCSRREAEELIAAGAVLIDGEPVHDPGRKISPGQTLALSPGAALGPGSQISVMLNKPVGFVSGQPEHNQTPAARLLTAANQTGPGLAPSARISLAPLGRLDQDSRGLLLLSEDGVLAKAVIGPDSPIDKEYIVTVRGRIDRACIQKLRHGLELDGRALRPARVSLEDTQVLRFILTEGRNRQIRRMCELVGLEVTDLVRVRIGPLRLGDLPEGRWRHLTPPERDALTGPAG